MPDDTIFNNRFPKAPERGECAPLDGKLADAVAFSAAAWPGLDEIEAVVAASAEALIKLV